MAQNQAPLKFETPIQKKRDDQYMLIELLAKVRLSASIKMPKYFASIAIPPGTVPAHMSSFHCLRLAECRTIAQTVEAHPIQQIDTITKTKSLDFRVSQVYVGNDPIPVQILSGLVAPLSSPEEIRMAATADQMAYLHAQTPTGPEPLFKQEALETITGFAKMPQTLENIPNGASKDQNANRFAYYELLKRDPNYHSRVRLALAGSIPADERTRLASPGTNQRILVPHNPAKKGSTDMLQFYQKLAQHRAIRGENDKITAGYYIAAMTRAMDKMFWEVSDIVGVCRASSRFTVFVSSPALMKPIVMHGLVANGMNVVLRGDSSRTPMLLTQQKIFIEYAPEPPQGSIYYESVALYPAPHVNKHQALVTLDEAQAIAKVDSWIETGLGRDLIMMRHLYLHPWMLTHPEAILASTHAHAGHVVLAACSNHQWIREPDLVKKLVGRAYLANKYKTNFPVGRATFVRVDNRRWNHFVTGFVIPALVLKGSSEIDEDGLEGLALTEEYRPHDPSENVDRFEIGENKIDVIQPLLDLSQQEQERIRELAEQQDMARHYLLEDFKNKENLRLQSNCTTPAPTPPQPTPTFPAPVPAPAPTLPPPPPDIVEEDLV